MQTNIIINKDCIEAMKEMPENSVDSIVTDPPAGIGFMGKEWDNKGSLLGFQEFIYQTFKECLRVLKPGGHAFVWAIPRTSHHTAMGLERAGFEIRDIVNHIFGSGFPKSLNIGKQVDKILGNNREVIKKYKTRDIRNAGLMDKKGSMIVTQTKGNSIGEGWGTALKPAVEHWILCRKPLSEKNVASNVLKWGTGGINIDGCRIAIRDDDENHRHNPSKGNKGKNSMFGLGGHEGNLQQHGRFPANVILDEEAGKMLDEQSGSSTSRFFYQAKASKKERNYGLEEFEDKIGGGMKGTENQTLLTGSGNIRNNKMKNHHPTVKPIKLMRYLVRLVTPSGGIVLDPFLGSGTTAIACVQEGVKFIGIEKEKEYVEIAKARIKPFLSQVKLNEFTN